MYTFDLDLYYVGVKVVSVPFRMCYEGLRNRPRIVRIRMESASLADESAIRTSVTAAAACGQAVPWWPGLLAGSALAVDH